jgi:hypothetical protein
MVASRDGIGGQGAFQLKSAIVSKTNMALWGRNLTDSDHLTGSAREFFGGILAAYVKPRTYGIEARYNF